MEGNGEGGVGGRRRGNCWNWLMYLFIQKASPSYYLRDSSPRSQCPCSLRSFQIFQASQRALSTTIQSKVGIQVHNNKKNQQPCKTVTDDTHNKHNASTLALHVYRTFLNIVWGIVLLTFTLYLVTGVLNVILVYTGFLYNCWYTPHTTSSKVCSTLWGPKMEFFPRI